MFYGYHEMVEEGYRWIIDIFYNPLNGSIAISNY